MKKMNYLISTLISSCIVVNSFAQADSIKTATLTDTSKKDSVVVEKPVEQVAAYDTLFKRSGFAIVGNVKDKNLFEVNYIKKDEKMVRKISTRELKSISYANGKTELIDNNPEKSKKDWVTPTSEVEWKRIKHTTNEADVAGMIEKGELEAEYEAAKITMRDEVMERNALAILQKKAFNMKANMILILSKDIKREYGEIPKITMKAKAYAKE